MTEQPNPVPEPAPTEESGFKRTARTLGTGLGCLAFAVGLVILVFGVLAIFFDDPIFWIAAVALIVALAAYKATTRGR